MTTESTREFTSRYYYSRYYIIACSCYKCYSFIGQKFRSLAVFKRLMNDTIFNKVTFHLNNGCQDVNSENLT